MSTLQVANLAFESTDNNQITYATNTINLQVGGASNVFFTNGTSTTIKLVPSIFTGNNVSVATSPYSPTSNVDAKTLTTNGQVIYSGNVSPTMLSASTADWNPGFGNAYFIRVSSNAALSIYGMVEGTDGQVVVLNNIGNNTITLSNEDAANENTATRRFNLPDNVALFPYSSISLIYDGIMARWRGQNTLGVPPYFYKKDLTKGFHSGGSTPTLLTTADRTTYSTETTAAVPGANLSQARKCLAAAGNACKGFFSGGLTPTLVTTADRTTYSTETNAAVPGANLSQARNALSAAGNACKGFFSGGFTPTLVATADRTTYLTETTAAVPGANLNQARHSLGAVGNAHKGFYSGGGTPTAVATADRTTYSTETTAAVPGANFPTTSGASCLASVGNACKGFFSAGASSFKTDYTTETSTLAPTMNLGFPGVSSIRTCAAGAGNLCKGFVSGGLTPPFTFRTDVRKFTYSTETTAAGGGTSTVARLGHEAV